MDTMDAIREELAKIVDEAPVQPLGVVCGVRCGPLAYLPDIALRFAVRTLTGDSEFTLIVPAIELVASKPFTLSSTTVLTPIVGTQLFWVVARTGSVDLSPDQPAVGSGGCDPAPPSADPSDNSPFPFGGCGAGDSAAERACVVPAIASRGSPRCTHTMPGSSARSR